MFKDVQNNLPKDLNVSNCPRCGTRLIRGRIIVTGLLKCSKCDRHWVIQMEKNKVTVTRVSVHFEKFEELGELT